MKRLAQVTAMILLTIGLVVLMWMFSNAVLLFLLSLVIAATVRPFANRLIERGIPRSLAYAVVYLLGVILFGALLAVVGGGLLNEFQRAGADLLNRYNSIKTDWPQGEPWQRSIADRLPERQSLIDELAGVRGTAIAERIIGIGANLFDVLAQLVVVVSLSIYWASDQSHFERLWLSLLVAKHRGRARVIWRSIETEVGTYVRSEAIQAVLAAIILGFIFRSIGVPYPIILALWAGITWLIPWLGVVLAVIPALLVGLLNSWVVAVLAALVTIVVFGLLELWLEPRLYGRSRINPVLVVIMLMVMAQYAGILGLLLAPPIAATIQILGRELLFTRPKPPLQPIPAAHLIDLRKRLAAIHGETFDDDDAPTPGMQHLAQQVRTLIDKVNETLAAEQLLLEPLEEPEPAQPQVLTGRPS